MSSSKRGTVRDRRIMSDVVAAAAAAAKASSPAPRGVLPLQSNMASWSEVPGDGMKDKENCYFEDR